MKAYTYLTLFSLILISCKNDEPTGPTITGPDNAQQIPSILNLSIDINNDEGIVTTSSTTAIEIVIPSHVEVNNKQFTITTIGEGAFAKRELLKSLTIPPTINKIKQNAFYETDLNEIFISDINAWCKIEMSGYTTPDYNGISYLWHSNPIKENTTVYVNNKIIEDLIISEPVDSIQSCVFYNFKCKSVNLTDYVKHVGTMAFSNSSLSTLIIGNGIENVGNSAFANCINLSSVEFGKNIKKIGDGAFARCSNLSSVKLDNNLKIIGNAAFYGCSKLSDIDFGNNVTHIYNNAFIGCNINEFVLPESIEYLGGNAFLGLDKLTLGSNIKEIGDGFIYATSNLYINDLDNWCSIKFGRTWREEYDYWEENWWNEQKTSRKLFLNGEEIIHLSIPSSTDSIKSNSFSYFTSISSVDMDSNVTVIGNEAFICCESLSSVKFSPNIKYIGECAFAGNEQLTNFQLPDKIETIGEYSFAGCAGLTKVDFPKSLTKIEDYAFNRCSSIKDIIIPSNVKVIGSMAFYRCNSLKSLTIEDGILEIGNLAFASPNLKEIVLKCKNIPQPKYYSDFFFDETYEAATLYVPEECYEQYKNDDEWGKFKHIVPCKFE